MEKNDYEVMITEIGAGRVLIPVDDADRAWNSASERAIRIINQYQDGRDLWQVTKSLEKNLNNKGDTTWKRVKT